MCIWEITYAITKSSIIRVCKQKNRMAVRAQVKDEEQEAKASTTATAAPPEPEQPGHDGLSR